MAPATADRSLRVQGTVAIAMASGRRRGGRDGHDQGLCARRPVGAQGPRAARQRDPEPPEGERPVCPGVGLQRGADGRVQGVVVGDREAEGLGRTTQPQQVPGEGEGDAAGDLAGLEDPVADGHPVVERTDPRGRPVTDLAVHPDGRRHAASARRRPLSITAASLRRDGDMRALPVGLGRRRSASLPDALTGDRARRHADVAQLVEHHLAKVRVAGSNPVVRSETTRPTGGTELAVEWPRGEATACKAVYTGSNPVSTSTLA